MVQAIKFFITRTRAKSTDELWKQTSITWACRIASSGIALLNLKIIGHSLTTDGFALVILVYSLMPWFSLLDIGLGAGLQNKIAFLYTQKKFHFKYLIMGGIGVLLLFLFWFIIWFIENKNISNLVFSAKKYEDSDTQFLLYVAGYVMIGCGISGMVVKIIYGLHRIVLAQLINLISVSTSCVLLFLVHWLLRGTKVEYFLALTLPIAIIPCFFLIYQIVNNLKEVDQFILVWDKSDFILLKICLKFAIFGILAALTLQVDYIFLAKDATNSSIAIYGVTARLMGVSAMLCSSFTATLMPRFTGLAASLDKVAIQKLIKSAKRLVLLISLILGIVIILGFPLFSNIIKPGIVHGYQSNWLYIVGLYFVYICIQAVVAVYSSFLLSNNIIGPFLWGTPIQASISLGAQYFGGMHFGAVGVIGGMIVGQISVPVWLSPILARKYINKIC